MAKIHDSCLFAPILVHETVNFIILHENITVSARQLEKTMKLYYNNIIATGLSELGARALGRANIPSASVGNGRAAPPGSLRRKQPNYILVRGWILGLPACRRFDSNGEFKEPYKGEKE
ncbi:MAG: hypothetical protein ACLSAP_08650 [Oscillospiraceae bacterium]